MSDLISRQAAIIALHDEIVARRLDGREQIDEFDTESILKQLSPASEQTQWIPRAERLPEVKKKFTDADELYEVDGQIMGAGIFSCYESEPVIVVGECNDYGTVVKGMFVCTYCEWQYLDGERTTEWRDNVSGELSFNVSAWMPLPEPYKEGER